MQSHSRFSWKHLLLIVIGGGGLLSGLGAGVAAGAFTALRLLRGGPSTTRLAFLTASLLGSSLFGLPLIWFGVRGAEAGRRAGKRLPARVAVPALLLLPAGLLLGHFALTRDVLPWLLGPLAHLLVSFASVGAILLLVRRSRISLSPRRAWSQFVAGLWGAPAILLPVEAVLMAMGVLVAMAVFALWPGGLEQLRRFSEAGPASINPAQIARLALHPLAALGVFSGLGVVVPLLEELIKPLGLLPLLPSRPGPGPAFLGGALSGAGYALAESLFISSAGPLWALAAVARVGTSAIHIFTAGLVGWGLGETFVRRKPLRLLAAYGAAVGVHGLWNGLTLAMTYGALLSQFGAEADARRAGTALQVAAPVGLALLALGALAGLGWMGRRLATAEAVRDQAAPPTREWAGISPPEAAASAPGSVSVAPAPPTDILSTDESWPAAAK